MGTEQTRNVQKALKALADRMGWSQKQMAREYYCETEDFDDEVEIERFEERFKKDLARDTTKAAKLQGYLDILLNHPEVRKKDIVAPRYITNITAPMGIEGALLDISSRITDGLLEDNNEAE